MSYTKHSYLYLYIYFYDFHSLTIAAFIFKWQGFHICIIVYLTVCQMVASTSQKYNSAPVKTKVYSKETSNIFLSIHTIGTNHEF